MRRDGTFLVPTLNAPIAIAAGGLAAGIPQFMVRKSEQVVPAHVASFQPRIGGGAHRGGRRSGTPLNFHGFPAARAHADVEVRHDPARGDPVRHRHRGGLPGLAR